MESRFIGSETAAGTAAALGMAARFEAVGIGIVAVGGTIIGKGLETRKTIGSLVVLDTCYTCLS